MTKKPLFASWGLCQAINIKPFLCDLGMTKNNIFQMHANKLNRPDEIHNAYRH